MTHREPIDKVLAEVAEDREQLLAKLGTEPAKHTAKSAKSVKPWHVVRQFNHKPDVEICAHRWEWLADLCAYRRTAGHASEIGVFYTVRRAKS